MLVRPLATFPPQLRFHAYLKKNRVYLLLVTLTLLASLLTPLTTKASMLRQEGDGPEISARAAIVIEYPSGRILFTKAVHDRLAPASTTKILTAILALEYGKLDEPVTIAPDDLVGESSMGLVEGEKQTLHDLLYGLLLPSGNDAAMAIARNLGSRVVAGDVALKPPVARFAEVMNVRVNQLGLTDSHFVNPSGLDADGHYSSAYDLASIAWYALHIPVFNEIVRQVSYESPGHWLLNTNELLTRYEGADGIKTGLTDTAGLCLVGSATRDGHRLISVVLNAPHWYADTGAILDHSFALLAADPVGANSYQIAVSKHGAVSWLLANAGDGSAPPMPLLSPGVQGGGAPVAQIAPPVVVAEQGANPPQVKSQDQPQLPLPISQAERTVVASAGRTDNILAWTLALFCFGGLVLLYKLSTGLWGIRPRKLLASVVPLLRRSRNGLENSKAGTVALHTHHHRQSRREPNLLLSSLDERQDHIDRAVALAIEEREGSSMAEFLLALRYGTLDIADLTAIYQLPPAAFLALARAQTALARYEDAQRTLIHGVTVLPHHRPLRMALNQFTRS